METAGPALVVGHAVAIEDSELLWLVVGGKVV